MSRSNKVTIKAVKNDVCIGCMFEKACSNSSNLGVIDVIIVKMKKAGLPDCEAGYIYVIHEELNDATSNNCNEPKS
jgi:hypothetical protein